MTIFKLNTSSQIPESQTTSEMERNAWIAPNGDFYGFDGAKHQITAAWIAIFKLGANEGTLAKGKFFSESWEGWLLKQGWVCVKNLSWLGDSKPSTFRRFETTEKQKTTMFDYCQKFGYDWEKIIGGEN